MKNTRCACTGVAALVVVVGIGLWGRVVNSQEPRPVAEDWKIKRFSNDRINLMIQEALRNGRSEFWVHQVQLNTRNGLQTILHGVDDGEFSTSLGSANATRCEVVKDDATGLTVRMFCKQEAWEAEEVFDLAAGSQILQRKQTYRFLKAFEGAIHPGFRVKAERDIRYTFPSRIHEQPLAGLKPVRRAVEWAVPLPFHVWHNSTYVAMYGLDKSGAGGGNPGFRAGRSGWLRHAARVLPRQLPGQGSEHVLPARCGDDSGDDEVC